MSAVKGSTSREGKERSDTMKETAVKELCKLKPTCKHQSNRHEIHSISRTSFFLLLEYSIKLGFLFFKGGSRQ